MPASFFALVSGMEDPVFLCRISVSGSEFRLDRKGQSLRTEPCVRPYFRQRIEQVDFPRCRLWAAALTSDSIAAISPVTVQRVNDIHVHLTQREADHFWFTHPTTPIEPSVEEVFNHR